jgi:hypothetical protein
MENSIQDYIDADKCSRDAAICIIKNIINQYRLRPPVVVQGNYDVIFEGMTLARYSPWQDLYVVNTALSLDRLYMIKQYCKISPADGCAIEFGTYKGGTAEFIAKCSNLKTFAVDSFEGICGSKSDQRIDLHRDGEYAACIADAVKNAPSVTMIKGIIPQVLSDVQLLVGEISFAHIDLDVYAPTVIALEYIWGKMIPGGYIVVDDYGMWTTPGVKKAVDEFCKSFIYLPTGQAVIQKC